MILEAYQNSSFVVASVLIAILTAYVAMETSSRIPEHEGNIRIKWVLISACCLGGGIWSMHFIGMLGYSLPIPVGYNVGLTVSSLLIPITMAAAGFYLAFQAPELSWSRNIELGVIYGLAIVAMHYTGMAAMRMDASIDWNYWYVFASIAVAIVAATAAIRASFVRLRFLPAILGSLIMGAAISGMHYTGMCAVTVVSKSLDFTEPATILSMSREGLGVGVTLVAFMILMTGLATAAYDRRHPSA